MTSLDGDLGIETVPGRRGILARARSSLLFALIRPVLRTIQRTRAEQFEELRGIPDAIVFLGDSITEGGLWSEWFPGRLVSNRGIGGETTDQILRRLDSAIDQPLAVFVLAGTNDLAQGQSTSAIADRLAHIVDGIVSRSPGCPVHLQSVMPRRAEFAAEILDLNAKLRRICDDRDDVEYVELWPALVTPSGALRAELTNDGLHLNGQGYAAWIDLIGPLVDALPTDHG